MKRKALGKGLRSLIPEAPPKVRPAGGNGADAAPTPREGLMQVDLDRIRPNRDQPRQQFDPAALDELARSMQAQGVLQPVVLRPAGDGAYELVAGERRWRAAQIAGLMRIPAVIREVSDDHRLELALIENLQREELNPIEEARAYQALMDDLGLTQQEVADRVGKPRTTIANAVRILNLPKPVQERVRSGELSSGHAKALAALTDASAQIELADVIVGRGLSVRSAEQLVARRTRRPAVRGAVEDARDPNVTAAEETLQRAIGTKVRILQGRRGSGRLELHFFGDEELDRLYRIVLAAAQSVPKVREV